MTRHPEAELRAAVARALEAAEELERADRSIESGRLIVAARVFSGAVEVYVEHRRADEAREAGTPIALAMAVRS
jgi:hypothetical protein